MDETANQNKAAKMQGHNASTKDSIICSDKGQETKGEEGKAVPPIGGSENVDATAAAATGQEESKAGLGVAVMPNQSQGASDMQHPIPLRHNDGHDTAQHETALQHTETAQQHKSSQGGSGSTISNDRASSLSASCSNISGE